jgi:hypothetical protein
MVGCHAGKRGDHELARGVHRSRKRRRALSVVYPDYDGIPQRVRIEALVYQPEQDLRSKLIFAP